jgi:hypothetical protein
MISGVISRHMIPGSTGKLLDAMGIGQPGGVQRPSDGATTSSSRRHQFFDYGVIRRQQGMQ